MSETTFSRLGNADIHIKMKNSFNNLPPDYVDDAKSQPSVKVNLTQEIYQSFLAHQLERDPKLRGAKFCLAVSMPCICLIVIVSFGIWHQMVYVMAALALSIVWVIELCPEIWLRAMRNVVIRKMPSRLSSYRFTPVVYTLRIDGIEIFQDKKKYTVPYHSLRACVPFSDMMVAYLNEQVFIFPFDSFVDAKSERLFFLTLEYRWAAAR